MVQKSLSSVSKIWIVTFIGATSKKIAFEYNEIGLCNIDKINKSRLRRLLPLRTDFTLEKEWKNGSK